MAFVSIFSVNKGQIVALSLVKFYVLWAGEHDGAHSESTIVFADIKYIKLNQRQCNIFVVSRDLAIVAKHVSLLLGLLSFLGFWRLIGFVVV